MVRALRMVTDEVSLAHGGIHQAELCKIAVAGIDVVQIDVFHGESDNGSLCNVGIGEKEQRGVAHEVLDVGDAKSSLDSDACTAKILVSIQHIGKANDVGHRLAHLIELVDDSTTGHGKRHLPGGLDAGQSAGVQESIEPGQDLRGQLITERLVGLFDGDLSTVFFDVLDGRSFRIFLDSEVFHRGLYDSGLAVRDDLAGIDVSAFQGNGGLVAHQLGAGSLSDGTHDAEDLPQRIPVQVENADKVLLSGRYVGINVGQGITRIGKGLNISRRHIKLSFLLFGDNFCERFLPLRRRENESVIFIPLVHIGAGFNRSATILGRMRRICTML